MKRALLLLLSACLMALAAPACADTFFVEDDGPIIHRDPLCVRLAPSEASLYGRTVTFSSWDELYAAPEGYLPCADCCADSFTAAPYASEVYYYNPDGGQRLHADPNCRSVASAYLPLQGVVSAAEVDASASYCPFCCVPAALPGSAAAACFDTLERKAAMLPGVWTLPSAGAISEEEAYQIAKRYVQDQPELMGLFAGGLFSCGVTHYDAGGADYPQETYKVLVTTVLRSPVATVYVDAITGEAYLCVRP